MLIVKFLFSEIFNLIMVKVSEHLENAIKFYEIGVSEYEDGKRKGNLILMREGCEKIFHAYIEACSALIQKNGLPEPESHGGRAAILSKLGEKSLVEIGRDAFVYLHKYAYYDSEILLEEVDYSIKKVGKAINYIQRKVTKA
ncbi:MAG: hypothetical protein QW563_06790 [Candidatus Methanomethylicia archaeon]